jgi:hypothetical protein
MFPNPVPWRCWRWQELGRSADNGGETIELEPRNVQGAEGARISVRALSLPVLHRSQGQPAY